MFHTQATPITTGVRVASVFIGLFMLAMALPPEAEGQEAVLVILPLRPFNFDISFNQRTFAPQARAIAALAGLTALRYGPLEVRTVNQYYSHQTSTFVTDQHSVPEPSLESLHRRAGFPENTTSQSSPTPCPLRAQMRAQSIIDQRPR